MRIFYIYPVPGELGWLLFNFLPHMQYQLRATSGVDRVIAHARSTYEGLYRFSVPSETRTFDYHGDVTEGNAFVLHAPQAYAKYAEHCRRCDAEVDGCRSQGHDVVVLRLPTSEYRYHRYKLRHRLFVPLAPRNHLVDRWTPHIQPGAVVFHLRSLSRSPKKNTSRRMYEAAYEWTLRRGRQFVTVGATLGYKTPFPLLGTSLVDKTTIDDLIAIFRLGRVVVGSSSGPMHLASLTRTPHVVWGGGRPDVRARYLRDWNPFETPVEYLSTAFSFRDESKLRDAMNSIDRKASSPGGRL